jgi:hypothetical protein
VRCCDGSIFEIFACIDASLIDINEELLRHPELLATHNETKGYLAFV